ncbi:hypothetical protein [Mycolicibacterium fortuitum]|uniref:hypothetical protein n=1 Tax=Mycolicibacterium fortuitum TaxID=1766 RepID=UPI0007EA1C9C|nr:hypothetical protein [Mycolicibacterium fortuitum]OBB37165.1 hypothetical protein A5763_30715 [Mycolicibacterium fortuitum]OBB45375.1 hypothetical protein A5754_10190 [Mycolicibacterium fortuitum]OBB51771.1 hypothetical protein A5755_03650 [Mycolicibacterium fortuitum]OBF77681.1 hypothetical protein A5751_01060 [Mycolicibacterium fortuitum]OBG21096.1 hypothetical protein A5768_27565 [Mycolicibacterium fortuitum]
MTAWSQLVSVTVNPDYDAQFETEFLDRPRRPADDTTDPALTAPVTDEVLGTIVMNRPSGFGETAEVDDIRHLAPPVPWSDSAVSLTFDAVSRIRLLELLPATRDLIAELAQRWRDAITYLWE